MKVEQISVFLENKAGRLAEVTKVLGEGDINIRALSLADTTDFGILRLIVDQYDKARDVLKQHGFTVGKTEVVAIEVPDRPGGLAWVLQMLSDSDVNVEYMYAFVQHSGKNAVIIFRFDNLERAIELLQQQGVRIYSGQEVYQL
ncbi:MAG TPA: ACT domain-containing protein [Thermodesulfobacteriota bacterium]|nr:ACT domain-containing protein [Thermodesulfobacteriota bacterium]